jgi:Family of unknown function (DUF6502)
VVQSVKHNLLAAFAYLLRPLVRIAIRNGVLFPEFCGMAQDAYVRVAAYQLRQSGREATADAISVMTEVGASDVNALLSAPDDARLNEVEAKINAAARVLVGWHTDRDYIGPYGLVRDLPFNGDVGQLGKNDNKGFVELAQRHCAGYPPQALLDELIRTECVQSLGNGFYRAITRSYVPEQLSAESISRFAQVVHNVIETLELNLRTQTPEGRRIERTIFADHGLPREEMQAFDKYLRARGQLFADDVDNWLTERSVEGRKQVVQTGIGFYHYVVNEDDDRDFGNALRVEGGGGGT